MIRRNNISSLLLLVCALVSSLGLRAEVLTLDSCLKLAEANSAAIRRAQMDVERAREVKAQALTKYFPQVQASAVAFHALDPMIDVTLDDIGQPTVRELLMEFYARYGEQLNLHNSVSLLHYGVMAGVTAVQPVYMGGKIVAGNRLAQLGVEAAELQSQLVARDALQEVEESYWLVVGLQDKRRTLARVTNLMDTVEHIVTTAVESGLALETDLMAVQLKRAELDRQRLMLESGLQLATRALAQSMGVEEVDVAPTALGEASLDVASLDEAPAALGEASLDEASPDGGRVEEQLLALQTRASELQRTMVIADALPKVMLGAHYGYSRTDANVLRDGLSGWNGALFATVSVPLTGWWETGHKIREQDIRLAEARLEQKDLTEKLALRTQQNRDQLALAEMMVTQSERALRLAERRAHLSEVGYRAGTVTITDLLTAEVDVLNAENALTDARIAQRVAQRRLAAQH